MNKKRNFKLVLMGDSGVGKTTFVQSLTYTRESRRQAGAEIQEPVHLPPEMFQNQECSTILYDTQCGVHELPDQAKIADVILLMYDISKPDTADRLKGFWLKELDRQNYKQPIIIIGNKLDLVDAAQAEFEEKEFSRIFKVIKPLVKDYSRVEMAIECSALKGKGIQDVVNCAQRSLIYPLAPIYSITNKKLTLRCEKALTRIFRICDKDRDGVWSDQELMRFQKKVFKRQLDQSDIVGIKEMIFDELKSQGLAGINKSHITLDGFKALQRRGIELMKIQICWTILRYYNYKDDLTLDEQLFQSEMIIDKKAGQTVELSEKAIDFLKQIFSLQQQRYEITQEDIDNIFFPVPFDDYVFTKLEEVGTKSIDQNHWIAMWNTFVYFNYSDSYRLLQYIGFDAKFGDCFRESNRKDSWAQVQKNIDRRTYHVAILTLKQIPHKDLEQQMMRRIIYYNGKTYIVTIYDQNNLILGGDMLQQVDFLVLDERLKFQIEDMVPSLRKNLTSMDLKSVIYEVASIMHQQPFGYSEIQIKQLKERNSYSVGQASILVTLGLLLAGFLATPIFRLLKSRQK